MKYFCSYAVGGCLGAIALSSFLTEVVRLIPLLPLWILPIFWALVAVVAGVTIVLSGTEQTWGKVLFWGIGLVVLGGCLGLA